MTIPPARRVVVTTEDPEAVGHPKIVLAKRLHVDGREMLTPRGSRVQTSASGEEPLLVSIEFFASEVLYTSNAEPVTGRRRDLHDLIANALFDGALVDGATCSPLLHEEAENLAHYVLDVIGDKADVVLDAYYSKNGV